MTEQEMLKEALEWQEHIRKLITATDDELYHKRSKVFYWLLERVQELEEENISLKAIKAGNEELIKMLEQQNKRYREALEFYADKENYKLEHFDPNLDDYMSTVDYDEGMKARKALEVNKLSKFVIFTLYKSKRKEALKVSEIEYIAEGSDSKGVKFTEITHSYGEVVNVLEPIEEVVEKVNLAMEG